MSDETQGEEKSPQQKWNNRNPEKVKAAIAAQDAKRTRIVLSLYSDRPDDMDFLKWLKSQAGGQSLSATAARLLQQLQQSLK